MSASFRDRIPELLRDINVDGGAWDAPGVRATILESLQRLHAPELYDFSEAVRVEAAHQRERWMAEHDAGKSPADWFWLVGYLAGKALHATTSGDRARALHHTISTAAALANWHASLMGASSDMRPGLGASKIEELLEGKPKTLRRADRERLSESIGRWLRTRAKYWRETNGEHAVLAVASDLLNGEWDEDTAGGTIEARDS
jgi:hypothetical protein